MSHSSRSGSLACAFVRSLAILVWLAGAVANAQELAGILYSQGVRTTIGKKDGTGALLRGSVNTDAPEPLADGNFFLHRYGFTSRPLGTLRGPEGTSKEQLTAAIATGLIAGVPKTYVATETDWVDARYLAYGGQSWWGAVVDPILNQLGQPASAPPPVACPPAPACPLVLECPITVCAPVKSSLCGLVSKVDGSEARPLKLALSEGVVLTGEAPALYRFVTCDAATILNEDAFGELVKGLPIPAVTVPGCPAPKVCDPPPVLVPLSAETIETVREAAGWLTMGPGRKARLRKALVELERVEGVKVKP